MPGKGSHTYGDGKKSVEARERAIAEKRAAREKNKAGFLAFLEKHHGAVHLACKEYGICKMTYFNWRNGDEEFAKAADAAWEGVVDRIENRLVKIAMGETKADKVAVTAACAVLNARAKNRGYGIHRQEQSGPNGGPVPHEIRVSFVSPD